MNTWYNKYKIYIISILLLVGCQTTKPLPLPLPETRNIQTVYKTYLPYGGTQTNNNKKGVAVANHICADVGASWYYNWSEISDNCYNQQFIPMIWCRNQHINITVNSLVFVMNEPDRYDQCNLTPEAAAYIWHEIELAYPTAKLIGPAISQDGLQWLETWYNKYLAIYKQPPRMYAMNVHCYLDAYLCQQWLITNLELAAKWTSSKQVYLTEFAMLPCWYTKDGIQRSISEGDKLITYLNRESRIATYAWFVSYIQPDNPTGFGKDCDTSLLDSSNRRTVFGNWYNQK